MRSVAEDAAHNVRDARADPPTASRHAVTALSATQTKKTCLMVHLGPLCTEPTCFDATIEDFNITMAETGASTLPRALIRFQRGFKIVISATCCVARGVLAIALQRLTIRTARIRRALSMLHLDTRIVVAGAIRTVNCVRRNRCIARPAEVFVSSDERDFKRVTAPDRCLQSDAEAVDGPQS